MSQKAPKEEKYNTIYLTEQLQSEKRRTQRMVLGAIGVVVVLLLALGLFSGGEEPAEDPAKAGPEAVSPEGQAEAPGEN